MPQRFDRFRGTPASVRHLARHEIQRALKAIERASEDPADAVHSVRQSLKRLRSLIRLPHGHFGGYSRENIAFRDLGRKLSETREADVLGETFDKLVKDSSLSSPTELRRALLAAHPGQRDAATLHRLFDDVRPGLNEAEERVADWHFSAHDFELLGAGLEKTFRLMRSAGLEAQAFVDAEHLHEWRKQVKHHAAHLRFLEPIAPEWLGPRRKVADTLADTLGEHHDLDMLARALDDLPAAQRGDTAQIDEAMKARRATIEAEAFRLREVLAEDTPEVFRGRMAEAWDEWRG